MIDTVFYLTMFICGVDLSPCPLEHEIAAKRAIGLKSVEQCRAVGHTAMDIGNYKGLPYIGFKCTKYEGLIHGERIPISSNEARQTGGKREGSEGREEDSERQGEVRTVFV